MQLEFHQLERRLEHLRVHRPERQQRLLASLAASGQQTPVIDGAAFVYTDRKTGRVTTILGYPTQKIALAIS